VPEPLQVDDPLVKYEFIRMPDSTGFGDYTESGQVIPFSFKGRKGGYTHCMFLNDHPPIAGGRQGCGRIELRRSTDRPLGPRRLAAWVGRTRTRRCHFEQIPLEPR
jgi:hypothetical protein